MTLLRLALLLEDEDKAAMIIKEAGWGEVIKDHDFLGNIAPALRSMEQLGWLHLAKELLVRVTPPATA